MSDLDIVGVERSYGSTPALRGIDLAVSGGETVAVLGPSGCGKTTLLRLVAGLDRPDAGTISIGGAVVSGPEVFVDTARRGVGMVFQDGALFPHLDVARNIAFGLDRTSRRHLATVDRWLDLVGLSGLGGRRIDELSGGQRQRVALARALAPDPGVLLLDEPFSHVDATLRRALRAEVADLLTGAGVTTLLVTHDRAEAFALGDRVAVIIEGAVAAVGTPEELLRRPGSIRVARVVGDPQIIDDGTGGWSLYWPEQLVIDQRDAERSPRGAGRLVVDAVVTGVTVEGATVATRCRSSDGSVLTVRALRPSTPTQRLRPGDPVRIQAAEPPVLEGTAQRTIAG